MEATGSEADSPPPSRHEFLKEARRRADADDPIVESVRDLLHRWGGRARGSRIMESMVADLENHGLITEPDFRRVTLDSRVAVVSPVRSSERDEVPAAVTPVADPEPAGSDDRDVGLTLGNLPSALGGVVSVTPQSTLAQAVTLMLVHDFSQIPVLSGTREVRGAVTWKSIAQAWHVDPAAGLADAIVAASPMAYDTELVEVLPLLATRDFVIVHDHTRAIAGIVTTTDVVNLYGELSTPFFLVGELDQELRALVASTFTIDRVRTVCDPHGARNLTSHDELTMGDYERTLQNPDCWATLGWPLDRAVFTDRLAELRAIRNDITHFNPDPVPPGAVPMLRNMLGLIRRYGD